MSRLSRVCPAAVALPMLLLHAVFSVGRAGVTADATTSIGTDFAVDVTNTTLNDFLAGISLPTSPKPSVTSTPLSPTQNNNGDIYSFIIHSKIKYRYAQTVVSSRVVNKGNTSQEVQFYITLPESAFISKFLMEINEKVYEAYVKEKNEAKEEYTADINLGHTAAHVEQNTRDSNKFTVSVNVEAESKVTFNLTYEQLLTRKLGIYENVINVQPGQVVTNLHVIVDIEESSNITTLKVPDIKTVNAIQNKTNKNKMALISRESSTKVTITWSPTLKEQLKFSELGVRGQFIVQYDVDHTLTPNQVLIDDGYFVHFFAPKDLKPLRTHAIFVLDVSGSMAGRKLPQVKEAMDQILSEIHSDDFFSLIVFSDYAQVWTINATQETSNLSEESDTTMYSDNLYMKVMRENRFVFPASAQNIECAKAFIQNLTTDISTNMEDALSKAYEIAKLGVTRFKDGSNTPKPIIVFLTDGDPTAGITEPQKLIRYVSNTNEEKYPIYSLGFGEGADIDFLKKLSLNNSGFARVIYVASDASLQLRNFYKEISSPVLSNVTFKYIDTQVDNITVTKKSFNLLFNDTELVVAGKLIDTMSNFNSILYADSAEGSFNDSIIVTCFDRPISPPVPVHQSRRKGHLEKLWAYLYIQQLMDKYEFNKDNNSTAKAKALELALEYSFVTPLTSLVVVKPNNTATLVGPEKIKIVDDKKYYVPVASKFRYAAYSSSNQSYSDYEDDDNGDDDRTASPSFPSITYNSMVISTISNWSQSTDQSNPSSVYNLNDLKWLNIFDNIQPSITLNETNYQVLLYTSGQTYHNCTTSENIHGSCKHLKDCVVASILNSLDVYTSLFCAVDNIYAGICCLF